MDTDRLQAFLAVARTGSFSRAADAVFKTQPAVSHAIAMLEADLGERLFDRRGRTVRLTAAGDVLVQHATDAFARLDEARSRIAAMRKLEQGTLRLCTSDTTACYILPPLLQEFRQRYPGIELVIANRPSPVALRQVVDREADLAIITLPARHAALDVHELLAREDVVICPPDHPLAVRRTLRIAELHDVPLILLDQGSHTRRFIDEALRTAGVQPRVAMELGSIEVIKKMVQLGFGTSIVPRVAVAGEVAAGHVTAVGIRGLARRRLGLVQRRDGFVSLPARTFAELAVRHLRAR